MTRRAQHKPVLLPWERKSAWLAGLLSARRWRTLVALAAVALCAVAAFRTAERRARTRATRAAIAQAHRAVAAFVAELGRCPHSAVELVHPPKTGAQYLDEVPVDGWGRPLYIRCGGEPGRATAETLVVSAGPSGSFLADDNIF